MKKNCIILITLLMFLSSTFALDSNYLSFRITPRFEVLNGSINEFVFDEECLNTDNKLSQLDWDIKNIPVLGINADFNLFRYINIGFDGSVGIPVKSGNMQDYDWLNSVKGDGNYPDWYYDDWTELTNYSIHNNFLEKYITFSARLGVNIFLPAEIKLIPTISYHYDFISFSGKDGYSIYKWDKWQQKSFSGKVIDYQQELNAMLLGLSVNISTISKAFFSVDFSISPNMTFINAVDYHYRSRNIDDLSGKAFWDSFSGLSQIKANIISQYKFNKYHSLGLSTSLTYIPASKGDTRINALTEDGEISKGSWSGAFKDGGGTSRLIWSLGINYSFSL